MKEFYKFLGMTIVVLLIAVCAIPVFSQDTKDENTKAAPVVAAPAPAQVNAAQEAAKAKELSIYGEIQMVNAQTNSLTLQYYDYDNDEEKSIEIALGKDTKLENVKAIEEIKKGDWADVTYAVSEGKNTANLVSVEKEEPATEETPAPATE